MYDKATCVRAAWHIFSDWGSLSSLLLISLILMGLFLLGLYYTTISFKSRAFL